MNLSANKSLDELVEFPYTGNYAIYDAWDNKAAYRTTADGKVRLRIPAKGTLILVFGEAGDGDALIPGELDDFQWSPIPADTKISLSVRGSTQKEWGKAQKLTVAQLRNLAPEMPRFAGTLKYTLTFTSQTQVSYLDLGIVGETAAVRVNGKDCGALVASPFRFQVADAWLAGENTVEILVASNYGYLKRDAFSQHLTMPPTRILGPITMA